MHLSVLDTDSLGPGLDLTPLEHWGSIHFWPTTSPNQRLEHIGSATIVITNRVALDESIFAACPNLQLICLAATGYNGIDLAAARARGIGVCNVVDYSTDSVAQHTLTLVLALMENLNFLNDYARRQWPDNAGFAHLSRPFHELSGKTWGIIGLGKIGQRVASLAEAFGATVGYFSASGQDRDARRPRWGLEELLSQSDIVTIHAPLNAQTRALLGQRELGWMKPSAYLVNVGRGGILDELALAQALDAGQLAGAALDVMLPEPPPADHPLLRLRQPQRLLLTPHMAWASLEARRRCLVEIEKNIAAWSQGQRRNRVD